jgi:undecaprenyl-diphosphatase
MILFEVAIQLGAILAVAIMYWKEFLNGALIKKLIVAFIPTGVVGVLVYPHIKMLFNGIGTIAATLFIGGLIMIAVEYFYTRRASRSMPRDIITLKESLFLGLFQALAVVPGVSRSGSVIIGGLLFNIQREAITKFTFLLAVPTMTIATAYSVYKHLDVFTSPTAVGSLTLGMVISLCVALLVIRYFLAYVRKHSFIVFGLYRMVFAVVVYFSFIA